MNVNFFKTVKGTEVLSSKKRSMSEVVFLSVILVLLALTSKISRADPVRDVLRGIANQNLNLAILRARQRDQISSQATYERDWQVWTTLETMRLTSARSEVGFRARPSREETEAHLKVIDYQRSAASNSQGVEIANAQSERSRLLKQLASMAVDAETFDLYKSVALDSLTSDLRELVSRRHELAVAYAASPIPFPHAEADYQRASKSIRHTVFEANTLRMKRASEEVKANNAYNSKKPQALAEVDSEIERVRGKIEKIQSMKFGDPSGQNCGGILEAK